MMEQIRLCAVWPMENWLGSSLNQIQGWTAVRETYSRALEQGSLAQVYNWGDAGYVLSRGAIDRLLDEKFPTAESCGDGGRFWKNGDWHLGRHLATLDIRPADTRDQES